MENSCRDFDCLTAFIEIIDSGIIPIGCGFTVDKISQVPDTAFKDAPTSMVALMVVAGLLLV